MRPAPRNPRPGPLPVWLVVMIAAISAFALIQVVRDATASAGAPFPNGPVIPAKPINTTFPGLTTFRGNATRTYYGEGPVPTDPTTRWVFPSDGTKMCAQSAETQTGPTKEWCGAGWTGQPDVGPWPGGLQVRIGGVAASYPFLATGSGRPAC